MVAASSALAVALLWGARSETLRQIKDDDLPIAAIGLGLAALIVAFGAGASL